MHCANDEERAVLVIGAGNVGAGVAMAFSKRGRWKVVTVDPCGDHVQTSLRRLPHEYHAACVEEISDPQLTAWIARCDAVIYAAECGNRDAYEANPELGKLNAIRFDALVRRLVHCGARTRLWYIGGSWTRRSAAANGSGPPVVSDDSPPKPLDQCNAYETAKSEACENARWLSSELGLATTFCDWASVVPNLAPNFTISKMTASALDGQVSFSAGDFGRPLCHSIDAGRAIVLHVESEVGLNSLAESQPLFDVLLIPGSFTPFCHFAEVVRDEVELRIGRQVALCETQGRTPEVLRSRCISERLAAMGFSPDAAAVEEGLRQACSAALTASQAIAEDLKSESDNRGG